MYTHVHDTDVGGITVQEHVDTSTKGVTKRSVIESRLISCR